MLNAQDTQFTLTDEGKIFYQSKLNNPLPGEDIAILCKGESILTPGVVPNNGDEVLKAHLQGWLQRHISSVLELLIALGKEEDQPAHLSSEENKLENPEETEKSAEENKIEEPKPIANLPLNEKTKVITQRLFESLGVVPREELDDVIAKLDQDDRRALRQRRVRLGPVLVFIPALNKPAPVRLRALLWGLWNDKALPMGVPKDGVVSCKINPEEGEYGHYQLIGYAIYGGRAVRIDMLDRVITAVYEAADKGKFQAKHEMAEWLGCSIDGLYSVLEGLGHTKIYDPAEKAVEEEAKVEAKEEPKEEEKTAEEIADKEPADKKPEEKKEPQVKPELATFRLKKGKAFAKEESSKGAYKPKKDFKNKPKKDLKKGAKKDFKKKEPRPKEFVAEAKKKDEDNPFAILGQFKK